MGCKIIRIVVNIQESFWKKSRNCGLSLSLGWSQFPPRRGHQNRLTPKGLPRYNGILKEGQT